MMTFFDDFDTTDKRSLQDDGNSPSDGETIFVSESTNKLGDGREVITKESVKWVKNLKTGEWSKKRTTRHFVRLQNGTVLEAEDNGSGDAKSDGEMTKVGCIHEDDCKEGQFCDNLSYDCRDCLKLNSTCHSHKQCCKGSLCRDRRCEKITGKANDPCESDKDCKMNHCCAYDNGREVCKPYLSAGEECGEHHYSRFPSLFASRFLEEGKKSRCPCLKGLTCQRKHSFFLYNNEICVKQNKIGKHKNRRKEKKLARMEKKHREEEEEDEDEMGHERDEEMDFIPPGEEMDDDRRFDHEEEDDDEDEPDDFKKRSLKDDDDMENDDAESIFNTLPKILTGFVRGILDNFE